MNTADQIMRATRAVVLIEAARHVEGGRVVRSGFAYEFDMPRLVEADTPGLPARQQAIGDGS